MDKLYKGSSCEMVDAFVILTRQGVVLASDDAELTPDEDRALREMNLRLLDRMKQQDKNKAFQSWLHAQSELIVAARQEGYTEEQAFKMLEVYQMQEIAAKMERSGKR